MMVLNYHKALEYVFYSYGKGTLPISYENSKSKRLW